MRSLRIGLTSLALVCVFLTAPSAAAAQKQDSSAIVATIDRFHAALAAADSATVMSILSDDILVLESGEMETRAQYLAHHLSADIEFTRAVPSQRKIIRVSRNGNSAWVASTSTTKGDFKGRAIDSQGTELMVLTKTQSTWRISAIHWSSARRQK